MSEEDVGKGRVQLPAFPVRGAKLDLGCGNFKLKGAFGVDFFREKGVDLQWDLEKTLPKKFWEKFDLVYSDGLLDHLGNPKKFLEDCVLYAKKGGFVQVLVDNADYWRYHKRSWPFSDYHALLWFKATDELKVQHKMMFQLGHLETLFKLVGLEVVEKKFLHCKGPDFLLPRHFGSAYVSIVGKKPK